MAVFKCKMCGGQLEVSGNETVITCEYCGTQQTLPKVDDEVITNLYNRANTLRLKSEFDKAEEIYGKIIEADKTQAEAYWGVILCKYGIEYVEDPTTYKRVPTCHRASFEAVTADEDYKLALQYADAAQKSVYEAEAKVIDEIQKGILAISRNEKPYDVFICYKQTDESGKRTNDSVIANDIYYQLTQEGFKVFYAAITLEDKLGQEYEPYIFAALNSAKVMLVIGSKPEYFNAVWVKNEWSRFLKLMKADRSKLLIPCYKDMDAYELPEEFAHLQAQDMGKIGFINDVVRGIKKVVKKEEKQPEKETVVVNSAAAASIEPLLKRAFMFLEDGEWDKADDFCEQVLNIDPENALSYLGKLMAEQKVRKQEQLKNCARPFDGSKNYEKAVRFGDDSLKAELNGYIKSINDRNENERLTGIYKDAVNAMKKADSEDDYKDAAGLFKSISGFKDADHLAKECLEKAEASRHAAEKKAEADRIAADKAAKKRKKVCAIVFSTIAACIAIVILLKTVIIPNVQYSSAVKLMDNGKYDEAIAAFEAMDGYKDSVAQIENCQIALKDIDYNAAVDLINAGKIIDAYENLVALNGYKDSSTKASEIIGQYIIEKLKIAEVGDIVYFGAYEQDNNTSNGKENVEWIILAKENGKALVISKYVLDCQKYNSSYTDITWEKCSLRTWMNGTFLNNAFSAEEQAMIATTYVSADKNPKYSTNPGNATNDKVFLFSITEADKYFTSDSARACKGTDYCYAQGAYKASNGNCYWWLRSPGAYQDRTAHVRYDGLVYYDGYYVDLGSAAVRPAMWIEFN